jgi:hypothetical protein
VIRCSLCGEYMARSSLCSDLAVITLHWMSRHRTEYLSMHPECKGLI